MLLAIGVRETFQLQQVYILVIEICTRPEEAHLSYLSLKNCRIFSSLLQSFPALSDLYLCTIAK